MYTSNALSVSNYTSRHIEQIKLGARGLKRAVSKAMVVDVALNRTNCSTTISTFGAVVFSRPDELKNGRSCFHLGTFAPVFAENSFSSSFDRTSTTRSWHHTHFLHCECFLCSCRQACFFFTRTASQAGHNNGELPSSWLLAHCSLDFLHDFSLGPRRSLLHKVTFRSADPPRLLLIGMNKRGYFALRPHTCGVCVHRNREVFFHVSTH